jgi:hypothetical protein
VTLQRGSCLSNAATIPRFSLKVCGLFLRSPVLRRPVRLCNALKARSEVRGLAYDGLLLRSARADQITKDDQPGRNPDTSLQARVGLQITYSSDQLQSCVGVVLVRLWVTKVDEDPVAHVLGDETAEATSMRRTSDRPK